MKPLAKTRSLAAMLLAALAAAPGAALAAGSNTDVMQKLARSKGCTGCHALEPGTDGMAPIGPAWREVAARYRGQPDATDRLTQAVVAGSNPYDSHWAGKVAGLAMPPNAVAIKQADARRLVRWILTLDAAKTP